MFIILDSCGIYFDMCSTSNLAAHLKFFEVRPLLNVFIANAMSFPFPKPLYMAEQRAQYGRRWEADRSHRGRESGKGWMTESSEMQGHLSLSLSGCYSVMCMKLFPGPCLGSFLFELFTSDTFLYVLKYP